MTTVEKIELALIPIIGVCIWLAENRLPTSAGIGRLLLWASVLILLQGLIRDLWLLAKQKRTVKPDQQIKAQCMCIESTIGMTGVIAGIILLGFGVNNSITMNGLMWSVFVSVVMLVGFIIKDYVIEWNPLRIRKDKNHINIIVTWKK